jgi:hypothetical protein
MDGRDWMFISAGKTIRLLDWDWDWGTGSWVATATSMQSYVNEAEWSQLERGHYGLHSGVTSTTYDATFDVIVETGNEGERETISHTLRCTDPVPPEPPEPLKPYLTGPEMVRGEWHKGGHWWWPTYALTCSEFDLELVSPDGGPWALVPNGKLEIKYLNWDSFRKQWEQHPVYWWPTTINDGVSDWNMMLAHDCTIVPPITEHFRSLDGYKGVVTVTVIRYTRRLARGASRHHGSPGRRSAGAPLRHPAFPRFPWRPAHGHAPLAWTDLPLHHGTCAVELPVVFPGGGGGNWRLVEDPTAGDTGSASRASSLPFSLSAVRRTPIRRRHCPRRSPPAAPHGRPSALPATPPGTASISLASVLPTPTSCNAPSVTYHRRDHHALCGTAVSARSGDDVRRAGHRDAFRPPCAAPERHHTRQGDVTCSPTRPSARATSAAVDPPVSSSSG